MRTQIKFLGGPVDGDEVTLEIAGDYVIVPVPTLDPSRLNEQEYPTTTSLFSTVTYRLWRHNHNKALARPENASELGRVGIDASVDLRGLDYRRECFAALRRKLEIFVEENQIPWFAETLTTEVRPGPTFQDIVKVWAWRQ